MKLFRSAKLGCLMLLSAMFLCACGGIPSTPSLGTAPDPTGTEAPAVILPPTTEHSATPAPTINPELLTQCKPGPVAFTNVGFGFPNPSHKLPSLGTVKTAVLFADFSDEPATQSPESVYSIISPNAEKFFHDISYGKMTWLFEPHFVWLRLSQPSAHYGQGIRTYDGHLQFIQEAVDAADADLDFSSVDSVVVMVPTEATAIGYGPAFGANPGEGYSADGKVFSSGVTSGADLANWGFLWLNHETGHTMGLPDLYAYQYDLENYDDQHRFVGGFGLMGYIDGSAPEFFAFERWQLGWLDDEQICCQGDGEQTISLTAIELAGGTKAVIVPINENKVLVVESRRALGYDMNIVKEGALVYTVDTSVFSGDGALMVFPGLENDPYRINSPLAVGESVTVEGVTITVVESTSQGDTVHVRIEK